MTLVSEAIGLLTVSRRARRTRPEATSRATKEGAVMRDTALGERAAPCAVAPGSAKDTAKSATTTARDERRAIFGAERACADGSRLRLHAPESCRSARRSRASPLERDDPRRGLAQAPCEDVRAARDLEQVPVH